MHPKVAGILATQHGTKPLWTFKPSWTPRWILHP